jgi:hypothetical protein
MWLSICALLSLIGGWYELAHQYRAKSQPVGKKFYVVSGSIGWPYFPVSYSSCLSAIVAESGFRLSVLFPFRILHPALFIPWSAVETVEEGRYVFIKRCVIRVHGFKRRIALYGGAGTAVAEAFNRRPNSAFERTAGK